MIWRHIGGAALLIAVLSCGAEREPTPFDIPLPQPEVLVSTESALLGGFFDIAVAPDGRLWIADAMSKRVIHLDHDGKVIGTIGREGDGPGELRSLSRIAANDRIIRVWDPTRYVVHDYRPDGTHLADHAIRVQRIGHGAALSIDGSLVIPTFGQDSALAALHRLGRSSPTRLGPTVVPPSSMDLFALSNAIKAAAKQGRVATEARNLSVASAIGPQGAVWLLVQTEREVRKYSPDGTLLWHRRLEVPEVESAFQEWFRRTAELGPGAPGFPPVSMDEAREVGRNLWILMHGEVGSPSIFYLLDSGTGRVQGRLSVHASAPARGFNVDPARKRLYLAIPDEAAILTVDLRSVTGLSWE